MRNTLTFLLAISILGCGSGSESDKPSTNDPIKETAPVDPNLDTDKDGVPDVEEKKNGTNPAKSNLVEYKAKVVESFSEFESDNITDNMSFTTKELALLSSKRQFLTSLKVTDVPNPATKIDIDGGVGIWGNTTLDLTFEVQHRCPTYKLSYIFTRSTSRNSLRMFQISRLENSDEKIIHAQQDVSGVKEKTEWSQLVTAINDNNEKIRVFGKRSELWQFSVEESCLLFDSDLDGLVDDVEVQLGTNKKSADSDGDGLTDFEEVNAKLNPLDVQDASKDNDGDGFTNLEEVKHGFNPFVAGDINKADTDNDGLSNGKERQLGLDPFKHNDANSDVDNDGLPDLVEVRYHLNPIDGSDGANADQDNDGVTNGKEIEQGTNPNDHKLRLRDKFTLPLLVLDTSGDGKVNAQDEMLAVSLERYSLRKNTTGIWTFNDNNPTETKYQQLDIMPEVRSFRGRIDKYPDSAVFATIWPDCTISYDVFVGYSTKPEFELSADAEYFAAFNKSFENDGICELSGVSDAKYQLGKQANYQRVDYGADSNNENLIYWPQQGDDFHLFERPQSQQISFHSLHALFNGQGKIERAIAFVDYQVNLADQMTSRTFYERLSVSDLLIETSGKGLPDDGSSSAEWDDNWNRNLSEFWYPRRSGAQFWYENVYWNKPHGASGRAYGEKMMNSASQGNQGTYLHEMGHHYGSKHESFPERLYGLNAMRSSHASTQSTIVHQREGAARRVKSQRAGVRQHYDLRVPASDWNFHPLAQPDHFSVYRDDVADINVLNNDSDAGNQKLKVLSVHINPKLSSNGAIDSKISVNPDNSIHFEPPKGFIGLVDAYYVLADETNLTTRGILHINVEHNGISDVFTFDESCIDTKADVRSEFTSTGNDANVSLFNWGYKGNRYKDEHGEPYKVSCEVFNNQMGASQAVTDKSVTWAVTQGKLFSNELNNEAGSVHRYHPHVFEVNNKNFSISFWYKPDSSLDLNGYTELARRGRRFGSGWDGDGWVVSAEGNKLNFLIHDKSKTTLNRKLSLDIPNVEALLNVDNWVHIGMTLDWDTRKLIAYVNGEQKGDADIPTEFSLVSSSGTGHAYARGAYAVFGQSKTLYTTFNHAGLDDLVIAHKALSQHEMSQIFNKKLPAFMPKPTNGKSLAIELLSSLSWLKHSNFDEGFTQYRVYFSDNNASVSNRESTSRLDESLINGNSADISSIQLDATKAYYWAVDIVSDNNEVVKGEVWSFWQKQQSVYRTLSQLLRIKTPEQLKDYDDIYEGDIQFSPNYEFYKEKRDQ
ncbi:LamG-like jellyroll fold domain-containing protein [Parashewanella tropica]|uniref:LamG-like jellyroll fold domain-containing protein n=1 Tax=Parashewanella tropica TaxID=2547970 RepID=UPI001059D8CE|nr:LamG-like jellyroll fold domain-containing protein [Parashewanella tropica]